MEEKTQKIEKLEIEAKELRAFVENRLSSEDVHNLKAAPHTPDRLEKLARELETLEFENKNLLMYKTNYKALEEELAISKSELEEIKQNKKFWDEYSKSDTGPGKVYGEL